MKRNISILLVVVLLFSILPLNAGATSEPAIQSIEIKDVEVIEYSYSHNGIYYLYSLEATITLANGSTQQLFGYWETEDGYYYIESNAYDLQLLEPWTVGNTYTVTGTLLGVSDTFQVTVVPSPVESIVLEDMLLYEGVDWWGGQYSFNPVLAEIKLKDGTFATIEDNGSFVYNGETYYVSDNAYDLQYAEPWTVGSTYTVTGTLLGATDTYEVTVAQNPIRELEIVKQPDKTEYLVGECFDLKGSVIRVHFTDGTYEDITVDQNCNSSYWPMVTLAKLNKTWQLRVSNWEYTETGEQTEEVCMFGKTCTVLVNVKKNPAERISIRENADKSVTITVHNSDGTSYDMQVLDMYVYGSFGRVVDGWQAIELQHILTDKGQFRGALWVKDGSCYIELSINGNNLISNSIPYCKWFDLVATPMYFANPAAFLTARYSGTITAENIDGAIMFAVCLADKSANGIYSIAEGDAVRMAVEQYFGIENVDLTLSEYYDAQNDVYTFGYMQGGGEPYFRCPNRITFRDGVWTIESFPWEDNILRMQITEEGKIISFNINAPSIAGDADGDGEVTDWDGVMLARYLAGWSVEVELAALDVDSDGEVTDWDGVVLDRYLAGWNVTIG